MHLQFTRGNAVFLSGEEGRIYPLALGLPDANIIIMVHCIISLNHNIEKANARS